MRKSISAFILYILENPMPSYRLHYHIEEETLS
jgi:hypothetical protein